MTEILGYTLGADFLSQSDREGGIEMRTFYPIEVIDAEEGSDAPGAPARTKFPVTIKSQAYDRDNHAFQIKSIRLPSDGVPILKHHDRYGDPLGWVDEFGKTDAATPRLTGILDFDSEDPDAMRIAGKVARKVIRYVSGGFSGVEYKMIDDPDDPDNYHYGAVGIPYLYKGRMDITKSELMEVSVVNTPADRYAKIRAAKASLPALFGVDRIRLVEKIGRESWGIS